MSIETVETDETGIKMRVNRDKSVVLDIFIS